MEKIQLREQFIRDMEIKGFAQTTIRSYVACVVVYAKRYKVSPELLGEAEIREHLHYLVKETKAKVISIKLIVLLSFFMKQR